MQFHAVPGAKTADYFGHGLMNDLFLAGRVEPADWSKSRQTSRKI